MLSDRRALTSSSPRSSEETMTNIDSPDTKLTAYSPEQLRGLFHSHPKRNDTQSLGGMNSFSIA
jgi:hypothetical protein